MSAAQPYTVRDVPLPSITIGNRLRDADPGVVSAIAESVSLRGLFHPITVSSTGPGYTLLAGLHRLRAFERLGRQTIPARVVDTGSMTGDELTEWLELVELEENVARKDLNQATLDLFLTKYAVLLAREQARLKLQEEEETKLAAEKAAAVGRAAVAKAKKAGASGRKLDDLAAALAEKERKRVAATNRRDRANDRLVTLQSVATDYSVTTDVPDMDAATLEKVARAAGGSTQYVKDAVSRVRQVGGPAVLNKIKDIEEMATQEAVRDLAKVTKEQPEVARRVVASVDAWKADNAKPLISIKSAAAAIRAGENEKKKAAALATEAGQAKVASERLSAILGAIDSLSRELKGTPFLKKLDMLDRMKNDAQTGIARARQTK